MSIEVSSSIEERIFCGLLLIVAEAGDYSNTDKNDFSMFISSE